MQRVTEVIIVIASAAQEDDTLGACYNPQFKQHH